MSLLSVFISSIILLTDFYNVPYFLEKNEPYYIYFAYNNPNLTPTEVVTYVNIGVHIPFYENIVFIDDPYYIRTLVSKHRRLPSGFSPNDLVYLGYGHYLRYQAYYAFTNMSNEMYAMGLPLVVRSSYRSYAIQTYIFNRNVANMGQAWADKWNARPGHSEHQLGLAIDILQPGTASLSLSNAQFEYTYQFAWLVENAYRFGYILSYPLNLTHITGYEFEPWHWRYIGIQTATYMFYNNIQTLAHYFATRTTGDYLYRMQQLTYQNGDTYLQLGEFQPISQLLPENIQEATVDVLGNNNISLVNIIIISVGILFMLVGLVGMRLTRRKRRKRRKVAPRGSVARRKANYKIR